jgi:Fe-S-cluster containining protein
MKKSPRPLPPFNGVSISKIELEQDGDLHVEYDLPTPKDQQSPHHRTDIVAKRTFDVYEDKELMLAARQLFRLLRLRLEKPDPGRAEIDCMRCKESRCCREYDVFVDDEDVVRLSAFLSKPEAALAKEHLDARPDWTGDYRYRLRKVKDDLGERCNFLLRDTKSGRMRCSVYEARPNLCRSFDEHDCTLFDDDGKAL